MASAKYGVIVCPRCGMARGVETSKKTTTCQCGREIKLGRVKMLFVTDSPMELAESVANANAALRGGKPLPPEKRRSKQARPEPPKSVKKAKEPLERMRLLAVELSRNRSGFTIEDLARYAPSIGPHSSEKILARLMENNLIYEVSDGRYKAV